MYPAISSARKVVLEEGGHYSYRRYPEQWNAIADEFLKDAETEV